MAQTPENLTGDYLNELQQILLAANRKMINESQVEDDAEIQETIKYEFAQTSWLDRLPTVGEALTVGTSHPELETVTGQLLFANESAIGLETINTRFLLLNAHITWVKGLRLKASYKRANSLDHYALRLVLSDFVEQQSLDTWYLTGSKSISGKLLRVFNDSVEIAFGEDRITLMLKQVVAVRSQI